MQNKFIKIANDTNLFLKNFIKKQKKTELVSAMNYGLFPGGKKIRPKVLLDIGSLFKIDYKDTIKWLDPNNNLKLYRMINPEGFTMRVVNQEIKKIANLLIYSKIVLHTFSLSNSLEQNNASCD